MLILQILKAVETVKISDMAVNYKFKLLSGTFSLSLILSNSLPEEPKYKLFWRSEEKILKYKYLPLFLVLKRWPDSVGFCCF